MIKRFLITMFIFSLSLGSCKKGNAEQKDKEPENSNIETLIRTLQGSTPKKPLEMFGAEFSDLDNKTVKLSDYKGKVIFLNLWATWCPPCRTEMPSMEKLHNDFKEKDFVIIAVSQGEDQKTVKDFLKNNEYSFPIFIDSKGQIGSSYGTGSIPTSYLIDKDGYIIAMFVGGRDWYSKTAKDLIDKLLK